MDASTHNIICVGDYDKNPPWKKINYMTGIPYSDIFLLNSLDEFPNIRQMYLEELRRKIARYENTQLFYNDNWEYYKKLVNPYELVYTQNKYQNFPQSICILKPLSRSYFKMIEILEVFGFFNELRNENKNMGIKTAHVCEGPGGFIEAIWDLAEKYRTKISGSHAITLRSSHTNIPGWRRASSFLAKHKEIHIHYGEDRTGDILKKCNQDSFVKHIADNSGKVHIYTADGGLDFSDNYENQEIQIFPILLASVKIGVECLRKNGMMIIKFFDIQRSITKQLLFLIQQCFTKWTLYKPAMSRPCNPEQYFIGIGFKFGGGFAVGGEEMYSQIIQKLDTLQPKFEKLPYEAGLPTEFHIGLNRFQDNLINFQIKYLELIFETIDKIHGEYHKSGKTDGPNSETIKFLKENEKKSLYWCKHFRVPHRYIAIQP